MKNDLEHKKIQSLGFNEVAPEIYISYKEGYRVRIAKIANNKYWHFSRFCFSKGNNISDDIISNIEELDMNLKTIYLKFQLSR